MRRIAFASPLNPAPSGISDYSEELLPYLGQYAEITLYVDDALTPNNVALRRALPVRPLSRLERDQRQQPYDAILYHVGNSPLHAAIWTALQRVPGVVVLHEFVLNHFMLNYAAVVRRNVLLYEAEAQRRYGEEGQRIAQLMMRGRLTDGAFRFPFSEAVIDAAEGVIAHSQYVIDQVQAYRPDLSTACVPMGVPLPPALDRDTARARLGIDPSAPLLASFGHVNPYKRVDSVLRALRQLRERWPHAHYVLVGSVSNNFDLHALIRRHGLEDAVSVTGYLERAAFEDYVAAADICLNLRHPTAGETSASLLRLLGAGRPTLVTASGSFTELPADVAAQVDPDASEVDLIVAYCDVLLNQPAIAQQLGANARSYVATEHTLEQAARGYMVFLGQRYGWETPIVERPPLWELKQQRGDEPTPSTPAPQPTETPVVSPVVAEVAEALASMGATEDDAALLRGTAEALSELSPADRATPARSPKT